ncbi:MAG: peptidylprolyl isomerase [Phycisphaeraceae bacterium]
MKTQLFVSLLLTASAAVFTGCAADDAAAEAAPDHVAPIVPRAASSADDASAADDSGYVLDGMVGQVGGRPLYADRALEPIADRLAALGRQLPPGEFRPRAQELIHKRLQEMVTNSLILGEAERSLSQREQQAVRYYLQTQREELLRRHGRGSVALAEASLQEQTGQGLEQTLEDRRHEFIVQRHLQQHLIPRINVSRRDVERYYRDHQDEFNPPASRTLRLIRVETAEQAQAVRQRLEQGESFAEVAASDVNTFLASAGGMMGEVEGDQVLQNDKLNQAMLELDEDEYAGPVEGENGHSFVYVEELDRPESKTLQEAQLEIRDRLRGRQYRTLSERYRQRLYEEARLDSLEEMTRALLEIAMNRYAAPATADAR